MQKKDSGKAKILLLVAETELVPHTDIAVAMEPFLSYVGLRKNVRELLEQGYIKEAHVPCYDKRYLAVTKEGIKYIENLFDIKLRGTPYRPESLEGLTSGEKRRKAKVGEALAYLMGAGVHILQREKPTLDNLLAVTNETYCRVKNRSDTPPVKDPWAAQRPVVHSEADVAPLLHDGIFYSSSEVKKCVRFQQLNRFYKGSEESFRNTRFIGVVLMSHTLYVIYNTRDNLMRWYDHREKAAEESMRALFGKCSMYPTHECVFDEGRLPAIVFGETMAALPALVTGHKGGVDKSVKHKNFEVNYKQLNSKIDAYWEMYFVPTEKIGQEILRATLTRSFQSKNNAERRFLEQLNLRVSIQREGWRLCGRIYGEKSITLIYLPFFDIRFMHRAREMQNIWVVTYPESVNMVSKSIGPAMKSSTSIYRDANGNYPELPCKRYGIDGRELDE